MAEVVFRVLLHVQTGYAMFGKVMFAIAEVTVTEPAAEVISVGKVIVGRSYNGEASCGRMRAARRLRARARWHGHQVRWHTENGEAGCREKTAAIDSHVGCAPSAITKGCLVLVPFDNLDDDGGDVVAR